MTLQAANAGLDRNPRNTEEARAFVSRVESLFTPWNIDALGFTDDCVVRFGHGSSRYRHRSPGRQVLPMLSEKTPTLHS